MTTHLILFVLFLVAVVAIMAWRAHQQHKFMQEWLKLLHGPDKQDDKPEGKL